MKDKRIDWNSYNERLEDHRPLSIRLIEFLLTPLTFLLIILLILSVIVTFVDSAAEFLNLTNIWIGPAVLTGSGLGIFGAAKIKEWLNKPSFLYLSLDDKGQLICSAKYPTDQALLSPWIAIDHVTRNAKGGEDSSHVSPAYSSDEFVIDWYYSSSDLRVRFRKYIGFWTGPPTALLEALENCQGKNLYEELQARLQRANTQPH